MVIFAQAGIQSYTVDELKFAGFPPVRIAVRDKLVVLAIIPWAYPAHTRTPVVPDLIRDLHLLKYASNGFSFPRSSVGMHTGG